MRNEAQMISVCMATYNGERFIEEQLACIYAQTIQPDEVIICDDASSDSTRDIIVNFIKRYRLEKKWKLVCNQERKGYPGNFYYCMSLAKGNYIFLADQDDIWDSLKIEKMFAVMRKQPNLEVLACKMGLLDAAGKKINTLVKPNYSKQTGKVSAVSLGQVLYKNEWSGMVLAYSNDWYRGKEAKLAGTSLPHDLALSILAAVDGGMFQMDLVLAWHRRHENNAAGEEHRVFKLLDKEKKLADIQRYEKYLRLILDDQILEGMEERDILLHKYQQLKLREKLLEEGKCLPVLKNYFTHKKEIRFFSMVCDLLICFIGYFNGNRKKSNIS